MHSGLFIYGRRMDDDLHLHDPPPVHLHDHEGYPSVVDLHLLAGVLGEMPEPVDDKPADGLVGFIDRAE